MRGTQQTAMNDTQAIQQVISLYSEGCSLRDWNQVVATFLPDGAWEVPSRGLVITGHDALRAAMAGFVAGFDYFTQINAPAIITVAGDEAHARTLIRECGKYSGTDEALEVTGVYTDRLVRTAGGWKFACRTFAGIGLHNFKVAPPRLPG